MTTIPVERELLEQITAPGDRIGNPAFWGALDKISTLLSEQPQAGAGRAEPVVPDAAQWPTTPGIESFQAAYLTKRVWELSAELEALKTQKPVAWGAPNSRITESLLFIELLHSTDGCQYPELLVPLYLAPQPAARHDQGDEVRRLREALKQAEKNERHRNNAETRYWCDQYKQLAKAALTHSQQGAKE